MREHTHPHDFDLEGAFPDMREIAGYEGSGVFEAERDGAFFVIIDERRFAGGLNPDDEEDRKVLGRLVRIMEFPDEEGRRSWLRLQLGP